MTKDSKEKEFLVLRDLEQEQESLLLTPSGKLALTLKLTQYFIECSSYSYCYRYMVRLQTPIFIATKGASVYLREADPKTHMQRGGRQHWDSGTSIMSAHLVRDLESHHVPLSTTRTEDSDP